MGADLDGGLWAGERGNIMSQTTALDREMIVTLEMADGQSWSGKVVMASIFADAPAMGVESLGGLEFMQASPRWSMQLDGIGDLEFIQRAAFIGKVAERQSAIEWECAFCGAVMSKAKKQCGGCGGWRSFVYDV